MIDVVRENLRSCTCGTDINANQIEHSDSMVQEAYMSGRKAFAKVTGSPYLFCAHLDDAWCIGVGDARKDWHARKVEGK